jgi:hypothetical protein
MAGLGGVWLHKPVMATGTRNALPSPTSAPASGIHMIDPEGCPLLTCTKVNNAEHGYDTENWVPRSACRYSAVTHHHKLHHAHSSIEIRNAIYAHLIEDVDTNVGPKTIRLRPRSEFSSYWRKKNTHRGEVFALNQVCRITRHEFGPLYVSEIAHRIRVDEQLLPRFLYDFFLSEHAGTVFALKPKKVEIELAYPLGVSPPRIDVLPLLSLSLGNEDLRCTFLNKFGPMPEVDTLFHDHAVAWGDAILDDLLEIRLYTPAGTTTCVDLTFRDDIKRAFIADVKTKKTTAPRSMQAYLGALRGSDVGTWDARVGVWNTQARVDFIVSKRASGSLKQAAGTKSRAFETQYRLVED